MKSMLDGADNLTFFPVKTTMIVIKDSKIHLFDPSIILSKNQILSIYKTNHPRV